MPKGVKDRSVSIGRDANKSIIVTGDRNRVTQTFKRVSLPPPESVDIKSEIAALRSLLSELSSPDARKVTNAIDDAEDELSRPEPDRDEVGKALTRAIGYAQKADSSAETAEKLAPRIVKVAGWLGTAGSALLALFGLSF